MAVGFIATGRSRRDRFWLVMGLLILGITAFALIRDGLDGAVIAGPVSGSFALAALLLGFLAWAQLLGLPRRLAWLLGIGLKSRALVFDNRLLALSGTFRETIHLAQEDSDRRPGALAKAEEQVRRMRAAHPPDAAWALLRDDMVADFERWIDLLRNDVPPDRLADHATTFAPVMARWVAMRDQAAQDQRLLASPARRRRGTAVWLATAGFSGLLIGAAQARGYDLLALGVAAPRFWLSVGALASGATALVGSLVIAIRR